MKGWRALGDAAEEMGSVPGFGWGLPEHEMVWAEPSRGRAGWGRVDTVKRLISSIFYLPLCLFCHIDHILIPLQDPIQPPLGAKDTGLEENRYWPRNPG